MTERFHGLDALRAGAMLLGVVLHAALIYTEPAILIALRPDGPGAEGNLPVRAMVLWIHLWRMPLFFILAGFFAQMVLDRRGATGFLGDRAVRILLTCLLFTLLFSAMTDQRIGTLDHLWFLWVLWWCCVLAAGLHAAGIGAHIGAIARLFSSTRRMLWLVVPLTLMSLFLRDETVIQRIPRHLSDVEWRGFLFCILFFWAGQALWHQRARLAELARPRVFAPLIAAGSLATAVILVLAAILGDDPNALSDEALIVALLIASPNAAIATGAISLGMIGLAQCVVTRTSALLSGLVQLAYPVYIFHLWFAIGVSVAILDANPDIAQMLNVAITSAVAFAGSALLYLVLVRYTPLEWLFAGWKNAWFQWPWTAKGRPGERPS